MAKLYADEPWTERVREVSEWLAGPGAGRKEFDLREVAEGVTGQTGHRALIIVGTVLRRLGFWRGRAVMKGKVRTVYRKSVW